MEEQKFKITLEVLKEVTLEFPQFKEFIEQRLEQEYLKGNMAVEEVISVFYKARSKDLAQRNIFYFVVSGFKAEAKMVVIEYFYNL